MEEISFEEMLYDNGVYDAWQFVANTVKLIHTADYCRKTILALINQMYDEHEAWMESLFEQLSEQKTEDGKTRRISIRSKDLPEHKVSIAGEEANISFLLDKLTKDFFQYSRNAFDCMSQVVNAACFANNAMKIDMVDFGSLRKKLGKPPFVGVFPKVEAWYDMVADSPEFQYVDAFCNRTKHTCDVYLKVSMAFLGAENQTILNPFFRKNEQHEKRDICTYLSEIYSYVETSFELFAEALKDEVTKKTYIGSRYHKLNVYQQKFNDNPDSNFSVVYINGTAPVTSMPEEINVLLLNKYSDGEIVSMNCPIDTIYINETGTEYTFLGKYVAIEPCGDDTLIRYRRYKREDQLPGSPPVFVQAMIDPENQKCFYRNNPYMDITSLSDDEVFLARIQLPF